MPGIAKGHALHDRAYRKSLPLRGSGYLFTLDGPLSIVYFKRTRVPSYWALRLWDERHVSNKDFRLGDADDARAADNDLVFDYDQAVAKAVSVFARETGRVFDIDKLRRPPSPAEAKGSPKPKVVETPPTMPARPAAVSTEPERVHRLRSVGGAAPVKVERPENQPVPLVAEAGGARRALSSSINGMRSLDEAFAHNDIHSLKIAREFFLKAASEISDYVESET